MEQDSKKYSSMANRKSGKFTTLTANQLSEEELLEYREIFNLVDRDGGGSISNEELGELLDTLGISATQDEIDLMIHEIDQDSNGEIDFEEFVEVMSRKVTATYTADQVHNAFRLFETAPGYIELSKLEQVLQEHCKDDMSEEQLKEVLRHLDVDSHGNFHFAEYIRMMMST